MGHDSAAVNSLNVCRRTATQVSGFTLIEVMIGLAVLSVLTLGAVTTIDFMVRGANQSGFVNDANTLNQEIRAFLSDSTNCASSLSQMQPVPTQPPTSTSSFTLATLADPSGAIPYQVNNVYENNSVRITGMTLDRFIQGSTPQTGQITLELDLASVKPGIGAPTLRRIVNIDATFSATGAVQSCVSLSNSSDGIWNRTLANPDNIYFLGPSSGGNVGIGTTNPTSTLNIMGTLLADSSTNPVGVLIDFTDKSTVAGGNFSTAVKINTNSVSALNWDGPLGLDVQAAHSGPGTTFSVIGAQFKGEANGPVTGQVWGLYAAAAKSDNQPTSQMIGSFNEAYTGGTGAITSMFGTLSRARKPSMATVNEAYGIYASADSSFAGGSIVRGYGGYFQTNSGVGGIIQTGYGVYIGANSGTVAHYGLYQSSASDINYLAGKVGLGKTSPVYALDVSGDVSTSGCVRAGGSVLGGICSSDERLKTDIQPFDLGLDALLSITPKTFRYNGLGEHPASVQQEIGVIAQEIEKSAPELVSIASVKLHKDDTTTTEIKQVNYTSFIYIVMNAVKEFYSRWLDDSQAIHGELSSARAEVKALKEEIEQLREDNVALKAYLCAKDPTGSVCHSPAFP